MKKHYLPKIFLFLVISISSCTPYKDVIYFEGLDRNSAVSHKIDNFSPLTIQPGDILSLNVKCLSPEGAAIFNTETGAAPASGSSGGSANAANAASGYLVDKNGEIQLPLIHKVKVSGMTLEEIQDVLQKDITAFLKEPIVTVHLLNFRITVIGDVGHSGVFDIPSDRISIPEVLSMAGDITITGIRTHVLLIREINGERKYANIDMTSDKLFNSPNYYLKNNDILYVEPGKGKFIPLNEVKNNLGIVLSLISLLLVIYEINRQNKFF